MRFLGRVAKFWLLFAFICISIYFAIYNQDRVHLQLPPFLDHITVPAYMAFGACFVLGAMLMSLHHAVDSVKKSLEIRRLRKRLRELSPLGDETTTAESSRRVDVYDPLEPLP